MYKEMANMLRKSIGMCIPITHNRFDNNGGCCALGAISLAAKNLDLKESEYQSFDAEMIYPQLENLVVAPICLGIPQGETAGVNYIIASLNNGQRGMVIFTPWSFSEIADWLESLDELPNTKPSPSAN